MPTITQSFQENNTNNELAAFLGHNLVGTDMEFTDSFHRTTI
ncbi:hypothetical protein [Alkalihalobacterium elongatum]|nr:hypothetical protein [Alkalihalobacterium elongatum]